MKPRTRDLVGAAVLTVILVVLVAWVVSVAAQGM
jgi:hypothetical protein